MKYIPYTLIIIMASNNCSFWHKNFISVTLIVCHVYTRNKNNFSYFFPLRLDVSVLQHYD